MRFLDRNQRPPIRRIVNEPGLTIYEGKAQDWPGTEQIDLVLTNPYGPLPASLRHTPMLVHQWRHRFDELKTWVGRDDLDIVGIWNHGREAFYAANIPAVTMVRLDDLVPEPGGWYPPELVSRLLSVYGRPGITIFDGFMGRGTIGAGALAMGMRYVGVEELPQHIDLALEYLGVVPQPLREGTP